MVYAVSPSLNPISLQVEENMTVFEGEIAHLNCKAQNLAEFTVSMTNLRLLTTLVTAYNVFPEHVLVLAGPGNHGDL